MITEHIVVEARYNGPDGSGNGGYVCGLVAAHVPAVAQVTLRQPPPLDRPLALERTGGAIRVLDGDVLVAEAESINPPDVELPRQVGLDEARAAETRYEGLQEHVFPHCFSCGPARPPGDGLHLRPGVVADSVVACTWLPADEATSDDGTGHVRPEVIWAALDCPGAWSGELTPGRPVVLGRLAVVEHRPLPVQTPVIVTGWTISNAERKFVAGTALRDADGTVYAVGVATWVRLTG